MRNHSPLQQVLQVLFPLLCAAGALSGILLLLYSPGQSPPDVPDRDAVPAFALPSGGSPEDPRYLLLRPDEVSDARRAAAGYDGVLVPMKRPDGRLAYVSSLPMAADQGTSDDRVDRTEAIRQMDPDGNLHTVAAVSCFRDAALSRACPDLALKRTSGAVWTDAERIGWLDPARPQVRAYLTGVCLELAQLGFDELLLTDCGYPGSGSPAGPAVPDDRAETLEAFCRQLQAALAEFPVTLSIQAMTGTDGLARDSGQSAALLASFSGRVWCSAADQTALAGFHPVILPEESTAELPDEGTAPARPNAPAPPDLQ